MAIYGSVDAVKQILQATDADIWSSATDDRLGELLKLASSLIEHETGATFLAPPALPTPETLIVETGTSVSTLYLPRGAFSVSALTQTPTWDGLAWTGGTLLDANRYRLAGHDRTGGVYRTIVHNGGLWFGAYGVTGLWEDQVVGVPDDITAIANLIAAELFKKEKTSPAGMIGPDGAVVPVRDVLKQSEVKAVLHAHTVGVGVWF